MQNQKDWERNRQTVSLKTALSDVWDKQHQLQHAAPTDTTKPSQRSLCLKYGMCLCSGPGAHARMMHAKLASIMRSRLISRSTKSAAKPVGAKSKKVKTPARVLMDSSMICLQLSAVEPPLLQFDAAGWPRLDDAEDAPPPDCWLHLNYINLKDMESLGLSGSGLFTFSLLEDIGMQSQHTNLKRCLSRNQTPQQFK